MNKNNFEHFIVTRFNVNFDTWNYTKNHEKVRTSGWLDHRYKLFQDFCLKSVMNQSNQNFTWCVLFDEATPIKYKNLNTEIKRRYSKFCPVYIDHSRIAEALITFIGDKNKGHSKFVITTRLDNDDMIHKFFVESIQDHFEPKHELVIDLRKGIQLHFDKGKVEIRNSIKFFNPFISVVERSDKLKTVLSRQHTEWSECVNLKIHDESPMWAMLIHSMNKLNVMDRRFKRLLGFDASEFGWEKSNHFNDDRVVNIIFINLLINVKAYIRRIIK